MNTEVATELKRKVLEEEHFINSKKYNFNILKYTAKNPVSPDNIIAHLLCIDQKEVQEIYDGAIEKIRQKWQIGL